MNEVYHLICGEKLTPVGLEGIANPAATDEVVPVSVVVEPRGNVRPRGERRAQQQMFERFERAPVDHLLAAAGERIGVGIEVKIDIRNVLAHHFDLAHVAAAQTAFVSQTDELDRERIEAHHLRGDGVDGDHVPAGEDVVLNVRHHASRTRPVAGKSSVHDGKEAGVDLLLDGEQVHQRFVDDSVGPVAFFKQQTAESVLHGAGHLREDVRLHGGQMDDVGSDEPLRDADAFGIDAVKYQHFRLRLVVNPLLAFFVQMDIAQAVLFQNLLVFVGHLAASGVDDDGAVVAAVELLFAVAVFEERCDDAVELPRRSRTGRIEVLPTDVDLERGFFVAGQELLVTCQAHQASCSRR